MFERAFEAGVAPEIANASVRSFCPSAGEVREQMRLRLRTHPASISNFQEAGGTSISEHFGYLERL